jgi:hypothetical protein
MHAANQALDAIGAIFEGPGRIAQSVPRFEIAAP